MDEVELERRLGSIEHKIDSIDVKVGTWGQAQVQQNGKVNKLMEWKASMEKVEAEAKGFAAGTSSVRRRDLALFGVLVTVIQTAIAIGVALA